MGLLDQDGTPVKPTTPVKQTKVVICLASRGDCKTGFALDLARLVNVVKTQRPDLQIGFITGTGTLIHDLRTKIAQDALTIDPDYLFWIDDDMRFPPDALFRLLAHDKQIVGANYPTRAIPIQATAKMQDPNGIDFWDVPTKPGEIGLQEVSAIGFGCVLIRADLFKNLEAPWFSMPYSPAKGRHMGEDVYFCLHAKHQAGVETWIDRGLSREIRHSGSFEYSWDHYDCQDDEDSPAT
jgi:hypothetical protein